MSTYIERAISGTYPLVAIKGNSVFPGIVMNVEVSDPLSILACEKASSDGSLVYFISLKENATEGKTLKDFYKVGTIAKVLQFVNTGDGSANATVEGIGRATLVEIISQNGENNARVVCKSVSSDISNIKSKALMEEVFSLFERFIKYIPKFQKELKTSIKATPYPGLLADKIAVALLFNPADKQAVLDQYDPQKRLETLIYVMEKELLFLQEDMAIHRKVRERIEANQREYYLREQLKVLQNELGTKDEGEGEIDEYLEKIYAAKLPKYVEEKLEKEVQRLAKTPYNSAESTVLRNYLDICLEFPFTKATKERVDVEVAKKILERDHEGLEKVKNRILEYIAVKQLNPELKSQILCLVGPPGVGKTSIAASIAEALGRKYVRVSLGGVRDEADIRGHRKTYVAAMPGRIVNAITQAKVRNPLILLDEIDKLTKDSHGDPASALLEVLDPEQNKAFRDHFMELPIDLSECVFIATANTLETVPRPLIDRMEIIELPIYNRFEKLKIAQNHLIPKQIKRHGLNKRKIKFEDEAVFYIIDSYTREAGVRNLEREIANICRKAAKEFVTTDIKTIKIATDKDVEKYLGAPKIIPDKLPETDEIGVVNGLAYTETGGDLLRVEVVSMPGKGKVELTGSLGEVMQESAKAAISYIRTKTALYNIDSEFYKNKDIHIHFPEGAIPKDGPSAGVALCCALCSELGGYPARRDVAMTGEITLHGKVLPIGGLKEKTMAAYRAGIKTVLLPEDNRKDMDEIDSVVKENLNFVFCRTVEEAIEKALILNDGEGKFIPIPMPNVSDVKTINVRGSV